MRLESKKYLYDVQSAAALIRQFTSEKSLFDFESDAMLRSAVERQFFDAAREALMNYTRDGGQAWAEFLKCLDMYAQEILSLSEMLNFVEPLLGKRNNKLFEEFKRIGEEMGFKYVASGPLVRSSYKAGEFYLEHMIKSERKAAAK